MENFSFTSLRVRLKPWLKGVAVDLVRKSLLLKPEDILIAFFETPPVELRKPGMFLRKAGKVQTSFLFFHLQSH